MRVHNDRYIDSFRFPGNRSPRGIRHLKLSFDWHFHSLTHCIVLKITKNGVKVSEYHFENLLQIFRVLIIYIMNKRADYFRPELEKTSPKPARAKKNND